MKFHYASFGSARDYDVAKAIGCDGLPPARLCLSHWPGNETPRDLKHDLSTGIALNFIHIPEAARRARFGDFEIVVNDHFDTDGLLAIFACLQPAAAMAHAEQMLFAAEAGDFWRAPTARSAAFDMAVSAATDPARSPLARDFTNLESHAREKLAFDYLLSRLPAALDDPFSLNIQIEDEYARFREDFVYLMKDAAPVRRERAVDLAIVEVDRARDTRAVMEVAAADRVLELISSTDGVRAELRFSTRSWFDGVAARHLPRPDLAALASRLQQKEKNPGAWIATGATDPFASLAFGVRRDAGVRDENFIKNPSSQSRDEIINIILQSLRESAR